jgi:hypothetical protein
MELHAEEFRLGSRKAPPMRKVSFDGYRTQWPGADFARAGAYPVAFAIAWVTGPNVIGENESTP